MRGSGRSGRLRHASLRCLNANCCMDVIAIGIGHAKNRITVANGGWHCKEMIRAALISAATAACLFAAFVAAALWLPQDQPTIRRHIVAAIEQGLFNRQFGYGPFGSIIWPRHTLDCALAGIAQ